MPGRLGYITTTALLVLFGGLWMGVVIALVVNGGKVPGPIALKYSFVTMLVLAAFSIRHHSVVRKICLPFAFLS